MNDPYSHFSVRSMCVLAVLLSCGPAYKNTSVVGKTIYGKNKHNDSETKKDLCFDHPSYPPVSSCLIGKELRVFILVKDLERQSLQAALCCSLQSKMLGGLHFIKDAVGEL